MLTKLQSAHVNSTSPNMIPTRNNWTLTGFFQALLLLESFADINHALTSDTLGPGLQAGLFHCTFTALRAGRWRPDVGASFNHSDSPAGWSQLLSSQPRLVELWRSHSLITTHCQPQQNMWWHRVEIFDVFWLVLMFMENNVCLIVLKLHKTNTDDVCYSLVWRNVILLFFIIFNTLKGFVIMEKRDWKNIHNLINTSVSLIGWRDVPNQTEQKSLGLCVE